jgi:protein O-mannosyl-transferase
MKRLILYLNVLLLVIPLNAQQRGARQIQDFNGNADDYTTYAVVVGISDYQDPEIPDLQFAHKDAEAFANWLHSKSGRNVSKENIRLLLNEQATAAKFTAAIDWLLEQSKENDQVIIYFCGHGDMESKILNQLGFLLLWDSPPHAYVAGALPVDILKQVITTLSVENKAKVLLIADACHAGKLAGNNVIGTQLTNYNLSQQFANEQKILACQANEYSIEGIQWGGGRGAFSWYLINGLYGLADLNNDKSVSLFEIERYLQDRVTPEVQPLSQIPFTVGDKSYTIAKVDPDSLTLNSTEIKLPVTDFYAVELRGLLKELESKADTSITHLYKLFQNALKEKQFLEPEGNCAEYFYTQLIQNTRIEFIHNYLRRNYAIALQDDAQQTINKYLRTDFIELTSENETLLPFYSKYPDYLNRAMILLGHDHYMYPVLMARKLFFEGLVNYMKILNTKINQSDGKKILDKLYKALEWQEDLPYVYLLISEVYGNIFNDRDSMEYYSARASEQSPSWVVPKTMLAVHYLFINDCKKSIYYLDLANKVDSNSVLVRFVNGLFNEIQGSKDEAERQYKIILQLDSTYSTAISALAHLYASKQRYNEAIEQYMKMIKLNNKAYLPYFEIAYINCLMKQEANAFLFLELALQRGSKYGRK